MRSRARSSLTPGKALYWRNLGDAYRWTPGLKDKYGEAYRRAVRLAEEGPSA